MSNVRGPWGAYVGLLALSFLIVMDYAEGQQIICSQKDPDSCPNGLYCDNNGMCVPLKTGADKKTTDVILGCVLGGVVIIVAVIIILYCGRWRWLTRLKERFGRGQRTAMTSGITSQYQQAPGMAWAKSLRKRFKLKLGGVKQNPYVGQVGMSGPSVPGAAQFGAAPNVNKAIGTANPLLNVNAAAPTATGSAPATNLTLATNIAKPATEVPSSQESIQTRYVVGQDAGDAVRQFESSSPTPYVATVELSGDDPEPSTWQLAGPSYRYLSGSRHSLNSIELYQEPASAPYQDAATGLAYPQQQPVTQVYYPQPSPRPVRRQINIQSPIPPEPIVMPTQQLEPPPVLEPAAPPPPVVPHTHQVYPSLYPSLGHGHTHAPAITYGELPRKY